MGAFVFASGNLSDRLSKMLFQLRIYLTISLLLHGNHQNIQAFPLNGYLSNHITICLKSSKQN